MPGMSMGMGMGGMGGIGPVSDSLLHVSHNSRSQTPADACNDSRHSTPHSVSHHSHTTQLPPDFISALPSAQQHPQHHHRRSTGSRSRRSSRRRTPSRGPPTYRVLTDSSTIVAAPAYGSFVPPTGNFGQGGYNPAFFNQGQGGGNWTNPHGNKRQRQNE